MVSYLPKETTYLKEKQRHKYLEEDRNEEETWGVDEGDHIDKHLHSDHHGPGEEEYWGCYACRWPQASPVPVVVFVDGMDHGEERDGHGDDDVGFKVDSEGFVVFLYKPVEPDNEKTRHYQLAKRF